MEESKVLDEHLLNIVQNFDYTEQSELQEALKVRGYQIPQATLSRKLKKLKIAKVAGIYKIIDFKPHLPIILSMQISEFGLIVLHTHPGQAGSLAYFFDQRFVSFSPKDKNELGILGTIAGDDTVLLIIKDRVSLQNISSFMSKEFSYLSQEK